MSYVADTVGTFKHAFFLEIKKRSLLRTIPPPILGECVFSAFE